MIEQQPARVGRYKLLRLLGRGAQATVWEARAEPDGARVALKRLHPEALLRDPGALARLQREAQLLGGAAAPGVVRLLDAGQADGVPFLVYELLEGARPLDEALRDRPLAERLRLLHAAAEALGALHARGVLHRDLSPGNVLVDAAGAVWLTDLGHGLGPSPSDLTRTGEILGTAGWVAPEVGLGGSRAATAASDVWSLGALLFLALTDSHPFPGLGLAQVLEALRAGAPSPRARVPALPLELDRMCRAALDPDPTRRPRDGAVLAAALLTALPTALPSGPRTGPTGAASSQLGSGRRVGRWTILGPLGAGGMGQVFRARDETLQRDVALKLLAGAPSPRRRERFRRELTAAARVRHPALVAVHEAGELEGAPFLIMDLVDGQPLDRRLEQGPLPAREAVTLVHQLAGALATLHAAGVLHRDLKPGNVLLEADGRPRLVDLGVALLADEERLTRTGQIVGTPIYMAPEVARGEEADARSDVYGAGAVLYEALTGEPPCAAATLPELLAAKQRLPVPPSRLRAGLDSALDRLCLDALQPEPGQRLASAAALEARLAEWLEGRVRRRRRPGVLFGGVGATLLLAGGIGVALRARSGAVDPEAKPERSLDLARDGALVRRELEAQARQADSLGALRLPPALVAALDATPAAPGGEAARLWAWRGLLHLARGERAEAAAAAARAGDLSDPAGDLLAGGLLAEREPDRALGALERAERAGLAPGELHTWRIEALLRRGVLDQPRAREALRALDNAGPRADTPSGKLLRLEALTALGRSDQALLLRDDPALAPAALEPALGWELALLDAQRDQEAGRWERAVARLERAARPAGWRSARGALLAERARAWLADELAPLFPIRRAPSPAESERLTLGLRLHVAAAPEPPQAVHGQLIELTCMCRMGGEPRPALSLALARAFPDDAEAQLLAAEHLRGQMHRQSEGQQAQDVALLAAARRALELASPVQRPAIQGLVVRGLLCTERWVEAEALAAAQLDALRTAPESAQEDRPRVFLQADLLVLRAMALRYLGRAREGLALLGERMRLPEVVDTEDELRLERLLTGMGAGPEPALAAARAFRRELDGSPRGDLSRTLECAWLVFAGQERWDEAESLAARGGAREPLGNWPQRVALARARQGDTAGAAEVLEALPEPWRGLAAPLRQGAPQALAALVTLDEQTTQSMRSLMLRDLPGR